MQLIFLTFNHFKKFLTIFNTSIDFNFIFNHNFNVSAACNDNLVTPECILTVCTELLLSWPN